MYAPVVDLGRHTTLTTMDIGGHGLDEELELTAVLPAANTTKPGRSTIVSAQQPIASAPTGASCDP